MKNKTYYVPLMLIFCLFFLWAISSNLLPTMIRQLMKTCELNAFEASFTETAYWLAYFICPIPIAMFMKKYSYKSGIYFRVITGSMWWVTVLPRCYAERILGISMYILHHCHWNVFFRNSSQSLCNRFGRSRKCAPSIESSTIIQWAGSFYSRHVSQQTDSEWQPLYRNTCRSFPCWEVTFKQNRHHETSYLLLVYVTH